MEVKVANGAVNHVNLANGAVNLVKKKRLTEVRMVKTDRL